MRSWARHEGRRRVGSRVTLVGLLLTAALCSVMASSARAVLYFSVNGPTVARAELDGTLVENPFVALPHSEPQAPRDVVAAIAAGSGYLFYAQSGGRILRSDLDGRNLTVLRGPTSRLFITGLAVHGDQLYWTEDTGVSRMRIDGTDIHEGFVGDWACGVAADDTYVYWGSDVHKAVGRAKLDGSDAQPAFIQHDDYVCGVAVDGSHIYWGNYMHDAIARSDLDGTHTNPTFITGATFPHDLAIGAAHLYWINTGFDGAIGRANVDGTGVTQNLVAVRDPAGLAVDSLIGTSTSLADPPPIIYGQPTIIQAHVTGHASGPAPAGAVRFSVDGTDEPQTSSLDPDGRATFSPGYALDVGDTVAAEYLGDSAHAPSTSSAITPAIAPAHTAVHIYVSPQQPVDGDDVTIIVHVVNTDTSVVPFGHVTFTINGQPIPYSPALDDDGYAGIISQRTPAGTYAIRCAYRDDLGGPADFTTSEVGLTGVVAEKPPAATTPAPATDAGTQPATPAPATAAGTPPTTAASITPLVPVRGKDLRPLVEGLRGALRTGGLAKIAKSAQVFDASAAGLLSAQITTMSTGGSSARARTVVLATGKRSYKAPATATLRLKLTAAGRRAARSHHKMTVTITMRFTPPTGSPASASASVKIKR